MSYYTAVLLRVSVLFGRIGPEKKTSKTSNLMEIFSLVRVTDTSILGEKVKVKVIRTG